MLAMRLIINTGAAYAERDEKAAPPYSSIHQLHFEYVNGEIFVPVKINGNIYDFLFDTGAPTVVSQDLVKELDLEATGVINASDGKGHVKPEYTYNLTKMEIADVEMDHVKCLSINTEGVSSTICSKVDGIIGADLMQKYCWQLNFSDSMLVFSSESLLPPKEAIAVHFEQSANYSPFVMMKYGDSSFYAEFDSGSNNPLTFSDSIYLTNRKAMKKKYVTVYGGVEQSVYGRIYTNELRAILDTISMDGIIFTDVFAKMRDTRNELPTIGTSFMRNYDITIDWKQQMIYLKQISKNADDRFTNSFGLSFSVIDSGLYVGLLWKNSEAEKRGIRLGDQVMRINGQKVATCTPAMYCELTRQLRQCKKIDITLRDKSGKWSEHRLNRKVLVPER